MTTAAEALDLPFEEAIRFFRQKASVTTRAWTDVYAAAHSRAFMVAGAATEALVEDFRSSIDKAIAEGTTLDEFRQDFDAIVEKHGWSHTGGRNWRSRIIFDTNLRTAYAAGRYAQMTEPATLAAFPYWQYNHSGALHPRLQHLSWDGLTLRADDSFWSTNYPPNGWHCGCFVIPSSARDLRRQGKSGPDEAPQLEFRAEEVGGRTVRVPIGVDPGFESNSGQAWMTRTSPGSETVAAAPGMIRRYVESALNGNSPDKSWTPVAKVSPAVAASLAMPAGGEMRLSAGTIRSHIKHGITPDLYSTLVELASGEGEWKAQPGDKAAGVIELDGDQYLIGVKLTGKGEVYVSTVHRTSDKQVKRISRRGRV